MIKVRPWNGKDLKGEWGVTIKVDGVRALWTGSEWRSRADKPLYNIPIFPGMPTDCEVYLGSLKDSVRAVRTQHRKADTPVILPEHLYSLDPLDGRLNSGFLANLSAATINKYMANALAGGYEGLVLRQGDKWLKVKPSDNFVVLVLGMEEGTGKHKGRMGFLTTRMGKVGTGFTDAEREEWWARKPIGTKGALPYTIEVECMHLTSDGKFRHPRFVRERFDKIAEE